jgi:hypothetical protein
MQVPQIKVERSPRTNLVRNSIIYVLLILAFGIAVPASKGLGFFDPTLLAAYACLGTIFAGPAAAQKFVERPVSFRQAIRWIVRAVLFGELIAVAILASGVATVYYTSRGGFFPPDLVTLGYSLWLGLAACLALASLAAWIAVEFSAVAARMALRVVFVGLLALYYLRGAWLTDVAPIGILICLMAAVTFTMLLRHALRKP